MIQEQRKQRQQWFIDRIGKRVFRNDTGCECPSCKNTAKKGMIISDEMHAHYLYSVESDFNAGRFPMQYFDTKEEVEQWLKTLG